MALHALQNVDDAVDVTREFLFPIDLRRWLKLAVVAFFLGGSGSFPSGQFDTGGTVDRTPGQGPVPELPSVVSENLVPIVVAVVAALLVLGLVFAIVGAIMEFVFVESLLSGNVSIRRYWSRRWGQGLRLFVFRVAIGLPFFLLFVGWLAILLVPLLLGGEPIVPVALFVLGLPVVFLLGIVYAVVSTFTTVFVVPLMIRDDSGVLAAWGRLWQSVKTEWKQYLVFALVWVGLAIGTGILGAIAIGIAAVAVLVPLGVLAAITYFGVGLTTLGMAVLAALAVVFVVALLVLGALIQVPILSYLRYYALLVLGDVEPEFDLVADRRPVVEE